MPTTPSSSGNRFGATSRRDTGPYDGVVNSDGWRPLRRRPDHRGAEAFVVTPFVRLARVHSLNAASDAAVAVALAGSIFFSISPDESRARVALYLLLTMAPFAVVTPLLGPAIDRFRGGRRMMILVTLVGRVILGFFLIQYIESLLLFPLAFSFLVLQKGYAAVSYTHLTLPTS